MIRNPLLLPLLAVMIFLTACGKKNTAAVEGTFEGFAEQPVYLEHVAVGRTGQVDTAAADTGGRFRFTVELPDGPAFYNLRAGEQGTIPLLLAPGERVKIGSQADLARDYTLEGSTGSAEIRELNRAMTASHRTLDSLAGVYRATANDSVLLEYSRMYIRQKREMIAFVVGHTSSLSAVYALYQRMPGGEWYFSDAQDRHYFQLVADSLKSRWPLSPHVLALGRDAGRMADRAGLAEMVSTAAEQGYPELELPDMFGKRIKLSSLAGRVILLDFWTSDNVEARIRNAELVQIYNELHDLGLEIYQVSLDANKLAWITAVQEQRLPWISVGEQRGAASPAARFYNVRRLPANVLIDRQGMIVGRDIPVDQLDSRLRELL